MSRKCSLKHLTSPSFGTPRKEHNEYLLGLGTPHLDSFNYIIDEGLNSALQKLTPVEFIVKGQQVKISIVEGAILPPMLPASFLGSRSSELWPSECRQSAKTYSGRLIVKIVWSLNGVAQRPVEKDLGDVPVMVKSKVCHLHKLSNSQLVKRNEHADEWGGYFIAKGHERIIRMLVATRRNYPFTIKRTNWKSRGSLFSEYGVLIRSVSDDQSVSVSILHFVNNGTFMMAINLQRRSYFIPVVLLLKCLVNFSDVVIFKTIMDGIEDDSYLRRNLMIMLQNLHESNIHDQSSAKRHFGGVFKFKLDHSNNLTDEEACDFILKNCFCIHTDSYEEKFGMLVLMIQKLSGFVQGKYKEEGVDGVMSQELALGGHIYLQTLKHKLQSWLMVLKMIMLKKDKTSSYDYEKFKTIIKSCGGVQSAMENFISTGNMFHSCNVVNQKTGLTIGAENINRMRYMSHFKSVHRGSSFTESRSTDVRKLLPDAWGFICPVHTPDGAPCGLLNHITRKCKVTNKPSSEQMAKIPGVLTSLGMLPYKVPNTYDNVHGYFTVLDGRIVGKTPENIASKFVNVLRVMKTDGEKVPSHMEIVFIEKSDTSFLFPGIFLFTGPARMVRPVMNMHVNKIEYIGTFEQVFLDICVSIKEAYPEVTTHREISKLDFLSNLANLIPLPDYNQSPRNMYQCQMGKQTMGTPCHNWPVQSETKLYRLQTPASPFFRPSHYDSIDLDDFAMGTNAIVAVVSYTGYDMEDAMIINKSSLERGFAYASLFKTEFMELPDENSYFGLDPSKPDLEKCLGPDGLPFPGSVLRAKTPMYCYFNGTTSSYKVGFYQGSEEAIIDNVKLCGSLGHKLDKNKLCISYRLKRPTTIGDKFASRAGQKGICSQRWPAEDLPFTESGLIPDIVFNPHGFPSRMTIAMMIECMAGKSASVHGLVHDASPFIFSEKDSAIDYFGKLLEAGGYSYYGTERMYSGVTGCEMEADIFFGVIHYQRLRHMVSDKWQVRSTGPTDVMTRQPIKGRKRGGGVRFGEMERDALISHGATFLLQDRLFNNSDKAMFMVCKKCGSILSPSFAAPVSVSMQETKPYMCLTCSTRSSIEKVEMPYIYKYLISQLSAVNINLKLQIND